MAIDLSLSILSRARIVVNDGSGLAPDWLQSVLDLASLPESRLGFVLGIASLAIAGVLWSVAGYRSTPTAGWLVAGSAIVGLQIGSRIRIELACAVGLLGLGGFLYQRSAWLGVATAVIGASLLSLDPDLPDTLWVSFALPAVALGAGLTISSLDMQFSRWPPVMLALSFAGVWATVPDTEVARLVMVSAMVIGWAGPIGLATIGYGGGFAAAGVFAWLAAIGGQGRPGSIIGGWACLGAFAVAPRLQNSINRIWILSIHPVLVVGASRVAGLHQSSTKALFNVLVFFGLAIGALQALARRQQLPR